MKAYRNNKGQKAPKRLRLESPHNSFLKDDLHKKRRQKLLRKLKSPPLKMFKRLMAFEPDSLVRHRLIKNYPRDHHHESAKLKVSSVLLNHNSRVCAAINKKVIVFRQVTTKQEDLGSIVLYAPSCKVAESLK